MARKIRVRNSKPRDLGLFRKLWKQFLTENEKAGSTVSATAKNMETPESLFKVYTDGDVQGIVLFVGDYAVLMAGDTQIEHTGRTAMLWGLYVEESRRKNGVATLLIEEAKKQLKAAGYNSVLTVFGAQNEAAGQIANKQEAKPIFVSARVDLG